MKIVVLGGGPGGYVAAITAKRAGADVILIERDELGGTCLNRGCIPTKTLISSLELIDKIKKSKELINNSTDFTINFSSLIKRKDSVVETQRKGLSMLLKQSGIQVIKDNGELISPKTLFLKNSSQKITFDKIIIATGSRPANLPFLEFDGNKILSSDDLWNLKDIPKSLLIIGAGAIGCEFAWIFHLLGSKVSITEVMPRLLPMADEDISHTLERLFKKRKIDFHTGVMIDNLKKNNEELEITLSSGKKIYAEKILVSVGRSYNTESLKNAEIKFGKKGEIIVDEYLETNLDGVFAVGDVNGKWLLAHVAYKEGEIAGKNIMEKKEKMVYSLVPSTIFTISEVASVGLKEKEAIEMGIDIKKGLFPFRAISKAHAIGEIDGFVKVLADRESDTVIGAHIIGPKASELIHELALAIGLKAKVKQLREVIHSHPTLSECIAEALADIEKEAIHKIDN